MNVIRRRVGKAQLIYQSITNSSITEWCSCWHFHRSDSSSASSRGKEIMASKDSPSDGKKSEYPAMSTGGSLELKRKFSAAKSNRVPTKLQKRLDKNPSLPIPNSLQLCVLGNGSQGTSKSLYLQSDHCGYLFNCGEATWRTLLEMEGLKFSKGSHILITHGTWWNQCGLLEMCLGLETAHGDPIQIHGCGGVDHLVNTLSRKFSTDGGRNLTKYDEQRFTDHCLTIESVFIRDECQPMRKLSSATAFKLKFKTGPRKVNMEKVNNLCLRPGPWIGTMQTTQQPVEVQGRMISPDDILRPFEKSATIAVVDCPTLNHLKNFISQSEELTTMDGEIIDIIIHLTPCTIQDNDVYKSWMTSLPESISHMVVREDNQKPSLWRVYQQQIHMNMMVPEVFPILHPPFSSSSEASDSQEVDGKRHLYPASQYILRPESRRGVQHSKMTMDPYKAAIEYISEENRELFLNLCKMKTSKTDLNDKREYPVLSCLGTSASVSTKSRNVSGYLLQLSEDSNMLLDCGIGTCGQLERLHGADKMEELLRNLDVVFISHGHPDHHFGLVSFMLKRLEAFNKVEQKPKKLVLMAPSKLTRWFAHLKEIYGCFENVRYMPPIWMVDTKTTWTDFEVNPYKHNDQFTGPDPLNELEYNEICAKVGAQKIGVARVEHAYGFSAFAIAVTHKDGWKLAYSGDTMPCQAMVNLAKDADLLLHEATFGDGFELDAKLKTHSTISQAIDIGKEAGAKFTLLTHFSARYPIMVHDYNDNFSKADNVGVAFDNAVCRLRDLPNLTYSNLIHILAAVYPKHITGAERKKSVIRMLEEQGVSGEEIAKTLNEFIYDIEQRQKKQLESLTDKTKEAVYEDSVGKEVSVS